MLLPCDIKQQYLSLGELPATHCPRCGYQYPWQLWQESEQATVLFIPVWRFTPRYLVCCGQCGITWRLPDKLAAGAAQYAKTRSATTPKVQTEAEHNPVQAHDELLNATQHTNADISPWVEEVCRWITNQRPDHPAY